MDSVKNVLNIIIQTLINLTVSKMLVTIQTNFSKQMEDVNHVPCRLWLVHELPRAQRWPKNHPLGTCGIF